MKTAISIVKILNSEPIISLSWGISNLRPIKNGIIMQVKGKMVKGKVKITVNDLNSFKVIFYNINGVKNRVSVVDKDELVDFIDSIVEG